MPIPERTNGPTKSTYGVVGAHEPPHDPEEPRAGEPEPGEVESAIAAVRLLEARVGKRCEHEADRDVHPEDPVPRDAADDRAADERPERDREATDAAPDAEREPAALRRHRCGEERERQGCDDRAADSLDGPRDVQGVGARRERREGRRAGEAQHPEHEEPAAAAAG